MKKMTIISAVILLAALNIPLQSQAYYNREAGHAGGSMFLSFYIGLRSFANTGDPFEKQFLPLGGAFEFLLTPRIGIGGTLMFDRWSDYLGMYGGKYTFRIYRPSFNLLYHLASYGGSDSYLGLALGRSIFDISNELGNDYPGDLKSSTFIAPMLGLRLRISGGVFAAFQVMWIPRGLFSGVSTSLGLAVKLY